MLKKDEIEQEGIVIESLPNAMFRVESEGKKQYLCTLSGKMRLNRIRVLPGDQVKFVITPYDPSKGRIIYRM